MYSYGWSPFICIKSERVKIKLKKERGLNSTTPVFPIKLNLWLLFDDPARPTQATTETTRTGTTTKNGTLEKEDFLPFHIPPLFYHGFT
jgi:hypothetical protein